MSLEQTIMRAHKNPLSRQPAKRARDGEAGGWLSTWIRMCELILGHAQQTRQRGRGKGRGGSMETKPFGQLWSSSCRCCCCCCRVFASSARTNRQRGSFSFRLCVFFLFSHLQLATWHLPLATCHTRQSAVVMKTKNERRKKMPERSSSGNWL